MHRERREAKPLRLLSVDPGRDKCGVAVVDERDGILCRGVVPVAVLGAFVQTWVAAHHPRVMLVGRGTGFRQVRAALTEIELPLQIVPEGHTTQRARQRYFAEHPPRGWRRLVPRGLLTPPVPVDDYAAVLIAEDFLASVAQESSVHRRK